MAQQGPGRPSPFGEGSDGLGYPTGGPPGGRPPSSNRVGAPTPVTSQPPGAATAAAVLGFVASVVHAMLALWIVLVASVGGTGASPTELAVALVLVLGWTTISAALAAGGLRLLQRADRTLLVRGSITEIIALVVVLVAAWVFVDDRSISAVTEVVLMGMAVAGVRLAFLRLPSVLTWLAEPVEHPDERPLRALLTPHALLLTSALLVFGVTAA